MCCSTVCGNRDVCRCIALAVLLFYLIFERQEWQRLQRQRRDRYDWDWEHHYSSSSFINFPRFAFTGLISHQKFRINLSQGSMKQWISIKLRKIWRHMSRRKWMKSLVELGIVLWEGILVVQLPTTRNMFFFSKLIKCMSCSSNHTNEEGRGFGLG
jgi:hypothetical protein